MLRWAGRPLFACSLLGLTGCGNRTDAPDNHEISYQGASYQVVEVDLARHPLSLHWRDPETDRPYSDIDTLRQWGEARGQRLLFAANAGIYDRAFSPLGLYVEHGRTLVPLNLAHGDPAAGNFSLLPNGVFAVYPDGHAEVAASEQFKMQARPPNWATQSGPMLVIDGVINQRFIGDSTSLKWRSGVCAVTPQRVVFAISEVPVNFHAFAELFLERLHCQNALYLDGTISQFYLDGKGYSGAPAFMVKPYAGIFAIFE
ncbi:phosphodiester glycosidase family protein [Frateuria aurantia]